MNKFQLLFATVLTICVAQTLGDIVCPDKKSSCPTGTTCCKLQSGDYGCCPMPNAVCCSDGLHCCPEGYTCDTTGGRCTKGPVVRNQDISDASPVQHNELDSPYLNTKPGTNYVLCPGGLYQCPDYNTCCPRPGGMWSCCPLIHAVCCSDYIHCCPFGTYCDVIHSTCYHSNGVGESIPWSEKFEAMQASEELPAHLLVPSERHEKVSIEFIPTEKPVLSNTIDNAQTCKDGSKCMQGKTCCENEDGQYTCCPFSNGVCCQEHCCPQGSTCLPGGNCLVDGASYPWQVKTVATIEDAPVICPDKKGVCPSNTTCCKEPSGHWGCCPFPNAVCCSDGLHCCPSGYDCDSTTSRCVKRVEEAARSLNTPLWTNN